MIAERNIKLPTRDPTEQHVTVFTKDGKKLGWQSSWQVETEDSGRKKRLNPMKTLDTFFKVFSRDGPWEHPPMAYFDALVRDKLGSFILKEERKPLLGSSKVRCLAIIENNRKWLRHLKFEGKVASNSLLLDHPSPSFVSWQELETFLWAKRMDMWKHTVAFFWMNHEDPPWTSKEVAWHNDRKYSPQENAKRKASWSRREEREVKGCSMDIEDLALFSPPCTAKLLLPSEPLGKHDGRFIAGSLMRNAGVSLRRAQSHFQAQYAVSLKQRSRSPHPFDVSYVYNKGYGWPSCTLAQDAGLCPYSTEEAPKACNKEFSKRWGKVNTVFTSPMAYIRSAKKMKPF